MVFHTLYHVEHNFIINCRCTLQIKQKGDTKADSNLRAQDGTYKKLIYAQNIVPVTSVGKWNNLFTAVMMLTNIGDSDLAITNMEGYYCTTGGRGLLVGMTANRIYYIPQEMD